MALQKVIISNQSAAWVPALDCAYTRMESQVVPMM